VDVRRQGRDRLAPTTSLEQRLGEILHRRRSDLVQPGCLTVRPCLVAELVQRRTPPAIERTPEQIRIAARTLQLADGKQGVDRGIETVAGRGRHDQVGTDRAADAGHDLAQRSGRDPQDPRQPFGAHRLRRMHRERSEEPTLARAGKTDHTVRSGDVHRTQNPYLRSRHRGRQYRPPTTAHMVQQPVNIGHSRSTTDTRTDPDRDAAL
jgi:hypothetical protein